jgi:hypothetical protein
MNNYRVIWEIDIEADSPEEAAYRALVIHRDPHSTATVFDVFDEKGNKTRVDPLDKIERDSVDPWSNNQDYPREDWMAEVANGDTSLGYLDWVEHKEDDLKNRFHRFVNYYQCPHDSKTWHDPWSCVCATTGVLCVTAKSSLTKARNVTLRAM